MGHCYPTVRQHHFPHLLSPGKTALWLLFFLKRAQAQEYLSTPARLLCAAVCCGTHHGREDIFRFPCFGPAFLATPAERCFVVKLPWFGVTFCLPHAVGAVL